MEYVVFESRLNNHSIDEINTFGNVLLSVIHDIRNGNNTLLKKHLEMVFNHDERLFPELFLSGVWRYKQNGKDYYRFERRVKGKMIRFHTKSVKKIYSFAVKFSNKYSKELYKYSNKPNNFLK
jgi:hypothetical protein